MIPWSPLGPRPPHAAVGHQHGPLRDADQFGSSLYRDEDRAVVEKVLAVAEGRGVSPAQVALAWLLAQPAVTSPIVGITKREHLDDAVAAVDLELTDDEVADLSAGYVPHTSPGTSRPALEPVAGFREASRMLSQLGRRAVRSSGRTRCAGATRRG